MTDQPPEIDRLGFDTQESKDSKYGLLRCRICRLTWYLPKDPARRTKDAMDILAAHVAGHGQAGKTEDAA
jgi:hypothetical protein